METKGHLARGFDVAIRLSKKIFGRWVSIAVWVALSGILFYYISKGASLGDSLFMCLLAGLLFYPFILFSFFFITGYTFYLIFRIREDDVPNIRNAETMAKKTKEVAKFIFSVVLYRVCLPVSIVLLVGNYLYEGWFPKVYVQGSTIRDGNILVLQDKRTGKTGIFGANIAARSDNIHLEDMFPHLPLGSDETRISSSDWTVKRFDERWKILQVAKELEDVRFYKRGNIKKYR